MFPSFPSFPRVPFRSLLRPALALLLAGAAALPASATSVLTALQLNVYRDGTPADWLQGQNRWLADGFDNGDPLTGPSFAGSSTAANYTLLGLASQANPALALREQGSALLLDPRYGAISPNAAGVSGRSLRLRLETNITDADRGLAFSHSFAGALHLSLAALPDIGTSFGLRLSDSFSNSNDLVELFVVGGAAGKTIVFRKQDFTLASPSITLLGSAPLPNVPAQAQALTLVLSHGQANVATIAGLYGFTDSQGLLVGELTAFSELATAFRGEAHTRLELRAAAPVPEPATWALMAGGLGLLGLRRKIGTAQRRGS